MANFTAGTSFSDGVTNDVTAAKLNALVADAVPTSNLSLTSTSGTIANFTASTANITLGTIPTLTAGTTTGTAGVFTSGTITTGLIPTLTAGTTTGTAGIFTSGTIATLNSTTGTIATLNSTTGTIATLNSTTGTIATLNSTTGTIATFNSTTGTIPTLVATTLITTGTGTAAAPAIVPTGDTNTGIFFPAADTLAATTNGTESLRIDSSGNVGIGVTPSSGFRLTSKGATATSAGYNLLCQNSSGSTCLLTRDDGLVTTGLLASSPFNNTTGGAANLAVFSDGNFGRSTSSIKYKKDVVNTNHGLLDVMKLRPVTYRGKSENDGNTVFGGLIAEEVHNAGLTEFVQYAYDGTPDALSYGNMVSLAFRAIQEQQGIIEELKNKITALEAA